MRSGSSDGDHRRATRGDVPASRSVRPRRASRRGISAVWLIVWIPLLMILSCLMLDVANVWLARVELENGLEAAALAAVKEWAESTSPTPNFDARRVGVAYACQNRVRGLPIVIGTNYDPNADPNTNPNENLDCCITAGTPPTGNLVFGAIDRSDPANPNTFNAGLAPSCGVGSVLFDVGGNGTGAIQGENAWGIAFREGDPGNPNLRIVRVEINLRAKAGTTGVFLPATYVLSSHDTAPPNCAQVAVHDNSGNCQLDVVGLLPANITQSFTGGNTVLVFTFPDVVGIGFEPGDRFRFGVGTSGVSSGNGSDDGDGIGRDGVEVTVFFNNATQRTGEFFDNTDKKNDCLDPAAVEPVTGSLIVHPTGIPDLPCPPASAANNNGQSYGTLRNSSGQEYAVRAQARVEVPTLWRSLFGTCVVPHCVTVKTTAVYNCDSGRPKLIRLDRYICPGP